MEAFKSHYFSEDRFVSKTHVELAAYPEGPPVNDVKRKPSARGGGDK
jgi:hypothetical protein